MINFDKFLEIFSRFCDLLRPKARLWPIYIILLNFPIVPGNIKTIPKIAFALKFSNQFIKFFLILMHIFEKYHKINHCAHESNLISTLENRTFKTFAGPKHNQKRMQTIVSMRKTAITNNREYEENGNCLITAIATTRVFIMIDQILYSGNSLT